MYSFQVSRFEIRDLEVEGFVCPPARMMKMEKVLHMNGGLKESSYAQNSKLAQNSALKLLEPILEDCILSMKFMESKTVCIADLGCSSGPNATLPAETIVKALQAKYLSVGIPVPQFQVFFNDLPCTDFNTLFRTLPPPSVDTDRNDAASRAYFAVGAPGSFYGRLFPDKSLHFVHSSYSLHWLSQVPSEVLEKNSVTWNKGKISAEGSKAVAEAYFRQYQKDFNAFLKARAEELVPGGRMVLLLTGRTSRDPSDQGLLACSWELLEISLNYLVSQGLIEEEKVNSFNIPIFCPCREEAMCEIEKEGSFEIQRLEVVRRPETKEAAKEVMEAMRGSASEKEAYGKKMAKQVRAVTESLLKYHFGEEVMDALFHIYGQKVANGFGERIMMEYGADQGGLLVMVLERK